MELLANFPLTDDDQRTIRDLLRLGDGRLPRGYSFMLNGTCYQPLFVTTEQTSVVLAHYSAADGLEHILVGTNTGGQTLALQFKLLPDDVAKLQNFAAPLSRDSLVAEAVETALSQQRSLVRP